MRRRLQVTRVSKNQCVSHSNIAKEPRTTQHRSFRQETKSLQVIISEELLAFGMEASKKFHTRKKWGNATRERFDASSSNKQIFSRYLAALPPLSSALTRLSNHPLRLSLRRPQHLLPRGVPRRVFQGTSVHDVVCSLFTLSGRGRWKTRNRSTQRIRKSASFLKRSLECMVIKCCLKSF